MSILFHCLALAAGEFLATFAPGAAEAWPVPAAAALLVFLFGYGLAVRGWPLACCFLLGAALCLRASVEPERYYRARPWMRGARGAEWRQRAREPSVLSGLRADCRERVALGLEHDRETAALNRALLLGERTRLPRRLKRVFVRSGSLHLFAISGLHVLAVARVLSFLLALCLVPRRLAGAASVPVLWGYVFLIGASPSAVRAASMATIGALAPVFWRRPSGIRAWALTFLAVHLLRPLQIVEVGSALSFAVMLALVLAAEFGPRWKGWRALAGMTLVAWSAGVPIAAHAFGNFAPGGLLANLALVTAAEWAVMTGFAGLLASFLSETLAVHLNNLSALLTRLMVGVAEAVSRLPGSCLQVAPWSFLQCAEWYGLIALSVFLFCRLRSARSL
ncbi:MAG: ComEC/Rec2 family competence protein [Kiritimatiellia bacterium]